MNNLNSVLVEGNLVRDPLFRTTPKGTPVCTFSIASNRFFRQDSGFEKEVGFFDIETWGKLAESCVSRGHKGQGVRIVGRLRQDRWQNLAGENRTRIFIVAEHVEFRNLPQSKDSPEVETEELELEAQEVLEPCFA